MTQPAIIKKHLIEYGHISGSEAWELYGIYRLSEVIRKLRRKGCDIETEMHKTVTKMGIETEYGVYVWRGVTNEQ